MYWYKYEYEIYHFLNREWAHYAPVWCERPGFESQLRRNFLNASLESNRISTHIGIGTWFISNFQFYILNCNFHFHFIIIFLVSNFLWNNVAYLFNWFAFFSSMFLQINVFLTYSEHLLYSIYLYDFFILFLISSYFTNC